MGDYLGAYGDPPPPYRQPSTGREPAGRRGGCVGCLSVLVAPVRIPARFLFASRDTFGVEDPQLRRLALARSASGLFATAVVGYILNTNGTQDAANQVGDTLFATYVFGGIFLIFGALVLAYRQRATGRRRHLLTPLYTYALSLLWLLIMGLSITYAVKLATPWPLLFRLLVTPCVLWWVAFFAACSFYLVRDMFRAADGNPLLAPVLSTTMALVTFLIGVLPIDSGQPGGIHGPVGILMSVLGVVSTGTLAVVEIRRLRGDHGITTRDGPAVIEKQQLSSPTPQGTLSPESQWPTPPPGSWRQHDQPDNPWGPPPPGQWQAPPQGPWPPQPGPWQPPPNRP